MESEQRDPRTDPRHGDRFRVNGVDYSVYPLKSCVWVCESSGHKASTKKRISTFLKWAENSEVVHVGGASPQAQEPTP